MATIIDGNATAAAIREELKKEVAALKEKTGKVPGLGVILVGERKDSETYVRMKGNNTSSPLLAPSDTLLLLPFQF